MKKIIIFGAGISGLTVAHELIEKNFEVHVFEADNIAGGMTRSLRYNDTHIPTEHSWRGYGPFYYNTYDILGRIHKQDKQNKQDKDVLKTNALKQTQEENRTEFTQSQVELHNKDDDAWIIYKGYIYDITHFVKKHPGGNLIRHCYGKDIEIVWKQFNVQWHMTDPSVITALKKNKIGKLIQENLESTESAESTESLESSKSLVDNLIDLDFTLLNNNPKKKKITINTIDYPYLAYSFLKPLLCNNRKKIYFRDTFLPYMNYVTSNTRNYLLDYVAGPGYGFDKNTISIGHYSLFLAYQLSTGNSNWKVMNAPTNEAWIDIWVDFLKNKGVHFHFNTSLQKIMTGGDGDGGGRDNTIDYCIDHNNTKIKGDEYIICINPNNLESIFQNSNMNDLAIIHKNVSTINNQISFRLGFNRKITFDNKHNKYKNGYVLMDSPFNITFYAQDEFWDTSVNLGNNIKSLWSGTCILTNNKGVLYNKTAIECTPDELLQEIITQFFNSKELLLLTGTLKESDIIFKEIFNDWYFNPNTQQLESKNKKWVNNIYNEEYRPDNLTSYNNLYLAGSHTKTKVNIWSMEGAVESGKLTSNHILKKYKLQECTIFQFEMPHIIKTIGKIDDVLYTLYLPHILDTLLLIVICIIIAIIYFIFYKK